MGGVESGKNSLHCPVGRPASGGRFGSAVAGRMKNEYLFGEYFGEIRNTERIYFGEMAGEVREKEEGRTTTFLWYHNHDNQRKWKSVIAQRHRQRNRSNISGKYQPRDADIKHEHLNNS